MPTVVGANRYLFFKPTGEKALVAKSQEGGDAFFAWGEIDVVLSAHKRLSPFGFPQLRKLVV